MPPAAPVLLVAFATLLTGCTAGDPTPPSPSAPSAPSSPSSSGAADTSGVLPGPAPAPSGTAYPRVDAGTALGDVVGHPAFDGFGRFLLPTTQRLEGLTLDDVGVLMPYHRDVDTATGVDVVNSLIDSVEAGDRVFFDIYTEEEKAADPSKRDTGLFFFAGRRDAPFAMISAGGGFSYVGSLHESLPYALELSRQGYHGFAVQYRTGGAEVAYEDLAAAISFVFRHADELGVSTEDYSLWGGSAGGRMAASLGSYGPAAFGGDDLPRPVAVLMQYTGHTDWTRDDPATYAIIGDSDGIASRRTMQARIDALSGAGVDTEFRVYPDLGHGFGLGVGTSAEGWIDDAVAFWERHQRP